MSDLLYFEERHRRPLVKISDNHVCKTKQMILERIKCLHQLKLNDHNVFVPFI